MFSSTNTQVKLETNRDIVTISLFSTETPEIRKGEVGDYNKGFLNEFSNIQKIRDGLVEAAIKAGRQPPEIVVSVLLIPDWTKENNTYSNGQYLEKKSSFIAEAKKRFEEISGVKVQDFYENGMTPEQAAVIKPYMHELKALGSNADLIKTCATINNLDRQHLQIDSNTIVPSFEDLYNQTFNAKEQKDGINASYYDDLYISAHNKMVYTTPTGKIAMTEPEKSLGAGLLQWCNDHKNDNEDKQPEKNSIYSKVFTKALNAVGYVSQYKYNMIEKGVEKEKIVYPASLKPDVYWLTAYMTTALNMSWSASGIKIPEELKKIPPISIGKDGLFNFQCFFNVIKKHTGDLLRHSKALGLEDSTLKGESARELLLKVSENKLELEAVKKFYDTAIMKNSAEVIELLSGVFPNTIEGNTLTQKLFGCTVEKLPEYAAARHHEETVKKFDSLSSEVATSTVPSSFLDKAATFLANLIGKPDTKSVPSDDHNQARARSFSAPPRIVHIAPDPNVQAHADLINTYTRSRSQSDPTADRTPTPPRGPGSM